ncbi:MAG: hypothetical protein H6837_07535 [Planctomycetes bacterium]|nr:hypothetical protein [Planctomycetota bacterium]
MLLCVLASLLIPGSTSASTVAGAETRVWTLDLAEQVHVGVSASLTHELHPGCAAEDPYDANWLRCSAEVEQGAFRGNVDASFTTNDFARFLSEMDRLMARESAAASFNTMEEALAFRIEVDRAGRATVVGKLRELGAGAGLNCPSTSSPTFPS